MTRHGLLLKLSAAFSFAAAECVITIDPGEQPASAAEAASADRLGIWFSRSNSRNADLAGQHDVVLRDDDTQLAAQSIPALHRPTPAARGPSEPLRQGTTYPARSN